MSSEESEEETRKADVSRLPAQRTDETHAKTSTFKLSYTETGSEPQMFFLPEGDTLVGRSRICNLVLRDPSASRRHARFEVREGRCSVEDLGSSTGTYKNGNLITSAATPGWRCRVARADAIRRRRGGAGTGDVLGNAYLQECHHHPPNLPDLLRQVSREPMLKRVKSIAIV